MLTGQQALSEQQQRMDILTADLNDARRERQEAWAEAARTREASRQVTADYDRLVIVERDCRLALQQVTYEKNLMAELLEAAHQRDGLSKALIERVVVAERHEATAQASMEWAVAHINTLTTERAQLLARYGAVVTPPVMGWQGGDTEQELRQRGAPAQPFDSRETRVADYHFPTPPPPGPVAPGPAIHGVPIPDGKTAGDVLANLREARDNAAQQKPLTPEEMLKAAEGLFEDMPEGASDDPTGSIFTE